MLYSMDWETGKITQITNGSYFIKDLEYLDEENDVIYFTAAGKETGINPYLQFLYRVNYDGSELRLLTPEDANHMVDFSFDGRYIVDNYSKLDQPTITVIRSSTDGEVLLEIGKTDISPALDIGWQTPVSFKVKASDDKTDIYGALWLPSNLDRRKSYPVIDNSYTGPHTTVYPKSFSQVAHGSEKQSLAELGFIVMVVDGRGSAMRSKEFHDHSYGRLGFSLQDHIAAIEQLSEMYSWIDKSRVGIYGHSAGGYDAAHALLQYPDFYKVAVSSSADHDHRMEKAWWPEMYMGWPVDSQYHQQSNITMAGNLKGKLLITHGGIDENVNPSATFKLAEALIKADKDFDMLILPGMRHGYNGIHREYFTKRKWNYFVENLQGAEPLWDFEF
jgi:dipeptidyl aminopeptidase/acylaminoacyl peptidase